MTHDILAISKLFLSNLRYNKISLMFNLLFPTIYFFYTHQVGNMEARNVINNVSFFWTYIIFVSVLNFMILPVINYRESGTYKQLWLIVTNKNSIMTAMFIVYTVVIMLELIIFNLTIMLASRVWQPQLLVGSLLVLVLFGFAIYMELTILLVLKIKPETITILATILIFTLFSLITVKPDNFYFQMISMLNPVKFILVASQWMISIITGQGFALSIMLQLVIVAIIMIIVGVYALKRFNISPLIKQM